MCSDSFRVCLCVWDTICVRVLGPLCTRLFGYAECLSCSQRALPQHLATSCEPCGRVSTTIRSRGKHVLHHRFLPLPLSEQLGRPRRAKRSSAFPSFSCHAGLQCYIAPASGLDLRWMLLSSSLAYRYLWLSSIQIPAFLYSKSPVSLY